MRTVYTFGDSILDCGQYPQYGGHRRQLLAHDHERLFPAFHGQDLRSRGPAQLLHRARDGATIAGLPAQVRKLHVEDAAVARRTVGGNDLLRGLIMDAGAGIAAFAAALERFLRALPIRRVLIGNVSDPTFGDDARNFLGVGPGAARAYHRRVNDALAGAAGRYGRLVDLHQHVLTGDPTWFMATVEPSLRGASEVQRAFLAHIE